MTRYLLTGATGFVGRRLTRMILAGGHSVTALARPSARAQALRAMGVTVIDGDLRTGAGLGDAVAGADRVIHLAALVKSRTAADFRAVNHHGTARLAGALAALDRPPRLVVCSSLAAAPAGGPVSHYGASKLAGEQAVREHADRLQAVILRPGIVYGPGEPALLPALIPMVRIGVVVKAGFGPRHHCLLHVDDLCAALLAAAERGATLSGADPSAGVYPVCDGNAYDWLDLCTALAEALGCRPPAVLPMPMGVVHGAARVAELVGRACGRVPAFNADKAREMSHTPWVCPSAGIGAAARELGYAPSIPLHRGLATALTGG
ncbi:NAD-dependent epimerase/dehydratase family protein [Nonomuraea phyllanthi]|uniref:NAD-dependent epimerase/dehydratase family protein n=1 Tax=Nonomuraea phyllanthi TaxID=2219224 RepID=UPI00129394FA|nr:NAD-dependent epimerase/dehydratase family protein [Nonomuraea phyllanthi]QFY13479.1 NAD-dependent epimerase/dehydratase family protein [Nonomuraea phyllanthi]